MNPHHHQLGMADATLLHVSDYLVPAAAERGGIVIMHGLGEHSGRYQHVAQWLNEAGWSVRCYDHRGHGRSQGTRGDVAHGDDLLNDGKRVLEHFATRLSAPPFLLGHSMGGLFAARFALERWSALRGLILSSPALALPMSPFQKLLVKVLGAVAPHLGVPNGLQAAYLSHEAKVVADYKADPLGHGKISAALLNAMLASVAYCEAHAASLAIPTLMLVAGDDHLVDAQGSKRFFAQAPQGRAQMTLYDGFYHEIFNETEARRPLEALRAWLASEPTL